MRDASLKAGMTTETSGCSVTTVVPDSAIKRGIVSPPRPSLRKVEQDSGGRSIVVLIATQGVGVKVIRLDHTNRGVLSQIEIEAGASCGCKRMAREVRAN